MKKYKITQSPFLKETSKTNVYHEEVNNIDEDFVLVRKKYYQSNEYAKIILHEERELSKYFNLNSTAKDILFYILNILEYNSPTFRLKLNVLKLLLNKSKSTIYKGINELIESNYIHKTDTKEVYWINHNYFYKGNYTYEYVAKKSKTKNKEYESSIFKQSRKN